MLTTRFFADRSRWCKYVLATALMSTASLACAHLVLKQNSPSYQSARSPEVLRADRLPLTAERKIRFTVNEGTWMSVDVSPDGRTIAFDLLGDIYVLSIEGGKARRILSGMAFDFQPRFSPDGRTLAFASDRSGEVEVWLADADGKNPRPLDPDGALGGMPAWSPDGKVIAANRTKSGSESLLPVPGSPRLFAVDGSGADSSLPAAGCCNVIFSADGQSLISSVWVDDPSNNKYTQIVQAWETYPTDMHQIARIDRSTGAVEVLTNSPTRAFSPVVSRDGRWLVYATRRGDKSDAHTALVLKDLHKKAETTLVERATLDKSSSTSMHEGFVPSMAFTPDSRALIVSIDGKLWRVEVPSGERKAIAFTADVELELGPLVHVQDNLPDDTFTARHLRNVRLSPDGRRLAFEGATSIYVAERNGDTASAPRRLTKLLDVERTPAWLPDSRHVVFATFDDERKSGHVYVAALDGSAPRRLTNKPGYYFEPVVTPDGRAVVVMRAPPRVHTDSTLPAELEQPTLLSSAVDLLYLPLTGNEPLERVIDSGIQPGQLSMAASDPDRLAIFRRDYIYDSQVLDHHGNLQYYNIRTGHIEGYDKIGNILDAWSGFMTPMVALSPDGRTLAVTSSQKLFTYQIPFPRVSPSEHRSALLYQGADSPSWTRDGRIVTSYGNRVKVYSPGTGALETIQIDLKLKTDKPQGVVAFTNARLLTMDESRHIEHGDLVISGNRIVAIGEHGRVSIPPEAHVIDATGKTILPGYIDGHAHGIESEGLKVRPAALTYLAYGVTTVRDPGGMQNQWWRDASATGEMPGPRMLAAVRDFHEDQLRTTDELEEMLCRLSRDFGGSQTYKEYLGGNRLWRQRMIMAAKKCGLMPTGHIGSSWHQELALAIDGYGAMEHWFWSPIHEDVVQLIARSGMIATPTWMPFHNFHPQYDVAADAKLKHFMSEQGLKILSKSTGMDDLFSGKEMRGHANGAVRVLRAGGRVGMGAHGNLHGLGNLREIWVMVDAGATPYEALQTGTIHAAHAIGLEHQIGSLEVGKFADLQVLDRNPLEDITNINSHRYVMKNGRLYDANTLAEVWPQQRPAPKRWWQAAEQDSQK